MHAFWQNQYTYKVLHGLIDSSCPWILNNLCTRPPEYALTLQRDFSHFDLETSIRVTWRGLQDDIFNINYLTGTI